MHRLEASSMDTSGQSSDPPPNIEDWTKEELRQWLLSKKVPTTAVDALYSQDVSGACLLSFEKQELIDLGIKSGPAMMILKKVEELGNGVDTRDLHQTKEPTTVRPKDKALSKQKKTSQHMEVAPSELHSSETETTLVASGNLAKEEMGTEDSVNADEKIKENTDAKKDNHKPKTEGKDNLSTSKHLLNKKRFTPTRPFDQNPLSFAYTQNDVLPPETGPTNLIEPIHEYKLLTNTSSATEREVLHKFTNELFRFAAGCMNRRTNGTIHFGIGDTKQGYTHGQVIGLEVTSPDKYIDEFYLQLKNHFKENQRIARSCIRPPKFIPVQSIDGTSLKKWVIEVDIEPKYTDTQDCLFYTCMLKESEGRKTELSCLFVREDAGTINVLAGKNDRKFQESLKCLNKDVEAWTLARKSVDEKCFPEIRQMNAPTQQGQRLQQLITLGRDTLKQSVQFLIVTDKCPESELEHLDFMKELKLFAVLDFDPESYNKGACNFFRKDRIANIHFPRMYNNSESISATVGKLNLYKQTSWIFCNGQKEEENEDEDNRPFDHSNWQKKRAGEVSAMINFMCSPDILPKDRLLVMFLLHSGISEVSNPLLETFCAIYRKLQGEENMVCICRDPTVFSQWKEVVQVRCQIDISRKCIYELSLREVNCTIRRAKEPQTQSLQRYLPSSLSSSVLLTKKEEDLMTFLDVLSENECENTEIEAMESFADFKNKTEEDFYRGGQVNWWNFYLSERPGCLPFIKRDKYETLYSLMTPTSGHISPCIIINLFHHPGCGGTTLAMHVLWNLRRKFRCAVVKNNTAQNSEIAAQVIQLLVYGKDEQSNYIPVLLLVDNWEDVEELQRCILSAAHEKKKQESLLVVILNCQRSQSPAESSRNSRIDSVYITNELSPKEQGYFQVKLKELKVHHEKPETFYAFMIMTNNFSEKYIEDLVCHTLSDLDVSTKAGQLISFLALLNTYVNGSCMSLSLCEEFVGIRNVLWGQETLQEKMNPYSTLLICFNVEEFGTYQAVRLLHQMIAKHSLKILIDKHQLNLSEITVNLLHCDLLYKSGMGKDILVQNILSMLITRQRKELGDDKDTLFSPLVEEMPHEEIKEVLREAVKRFETSASPPQALARHFYLKEKDFSSALEWALNAKQKNKNSYIADTLGQVYKGHLKHEMEMHEHICPNILHKCLELASNATKSFRESQELAKNDEPMDFLEYKHQKRRDVFNTSGYVGEMDVIMLIFQILERIPFIRRNSDQNKAVRQLLKGNMIDYCQDDEDFVAVIIKHEKLLVSLRSRTKEIFELFENYFTYLKPRSIERETFEERIKRKVSDFFKKYVKLFCTSEEERETERAKQPKISLQQAVEEHLRYLEAKRADTFAGLLQSLNEKNEKQMELILSKWQFVFENSSSKLSINRVNYILANIIVHCVRPKSTNIKRYSDLVTLLVAVLQTEGTFSDCTEVYFLAMLLLWPRKDDAALKDTAFKSIYTYVSSTKRSFHRRFHYMCTSKSCIAHFYLGNGKDLKRVVHKARIDQAIDDGKQKNSHQLWQSGAIWKEPGVRRLLLRVKGKTEKGEIYVNYPGNIRIPIRPVYLGGVRSGYSVEEVSFYVGFTMQGPVAYDLEYPN